jgi:hypothetical protein
MGWLPIIETKNDHPWLSQLDAWATEAGILLALGVLAMTARGPAARSAWRSSVPLGQTESLDAGVSLVRPARRAADVSLSLRGRIGGETARS